MLLDRQSQTPMVVMFVAGMNRSPDAAERSCEWRSIELTGIQYLDGRKRSMDDSPAQA